MRQWLEERRAIVNNPVRRFATRDDALSRMKAANPHLSDEQADHLVEYGVVRIGGDEWRWKFDPVHLMPPFPDIAPGDIDALWRAVRCQASFIYGGKSWPSSIPARIASALPDAETVLIEEAGHWPHHDQFGRFIDEVERLLRPCRSAS
jgi:pimeloyl-ACP methyl ester carboxylesterase